MAPIRILHEDDDLVVVDKPAGVLVTPAPGRKDPTLVDALRKQMGCTVYAVHRLDEDVTGALLLAKNQETRESLDVMFRERRVHRRYLALLSRMPSPQAGRIESKLREEGGTVMSVTHGPGEHAITIYRALERRDRRALVECVLETGRRNQIRVHMADIGCAIVGDRKYGYRPKSGPRHRRPLLHAFELAFEHPSSGAEVRVSVQAAEKELRFEG